MAEKLDKSKKTKKYPYIGSHTYYICKSIVKIIKYYLKKDGMAIFFFFRQAHNLRCYEIVSVLNLNPDFTNLMINHSTACATPYIR